MPEYVLSHQLKGEGGRLALMSELLDPMHRRYIDALGVVKPGERTLEVGCGNGSISAWLAEQVSPGGIAVAIDLDLSLVHVRMPNLELRNADIVAGPVGRGGFDLVTARAGGSSCCRRTSRDCEHDCKPETTRRASFDRT
jgi:protein-L-isoaspartate O-methyltransferase